MKKYNVIIVGSDTLHIEAESEEQAITKAHEYMEDFGGLTDYTIDWASEAPEHPTYSLHEDHDSLLKQIKDWEIFLDSLQNKESIEELKEQIDRLSQEMMAVNI